MKKCYSANDEEFNHESLSDLIDSMDDPKVGDFYFEGDAESLEPTAGINCYTVDSILENMDERIYEELGEFYDGGCSDVSQEAKDELKAAIETWANKHINLSRYFKIVGKTRAMKLTKEDLS